MSAGSFPGGRRCAVHAEPLWSREFRNRASPSLSDSFGVCVSVLCNTLSYGESKCVIFLFKDDLRSRVQEGELFKSVAHLLKHWGHLLLPQTQ